MKKQRCIAEIINITRKGEVKHFQVRIPENAVCLTGIETAVRFNGAVAIAKNSTDIFNTEFSLTGQQENQMPGQELLLNDGLPNVRSLAGELKLQSCEEANVFYAANVTDPSIRENLENIPTPSAIIENVWTHGYKREVEEILVDGNTTVLAGLYRDKMGAMQNRDMSYDVFLYVWYKLKPKKQ